MPKQTNTQEVTVSVSRYIESHARCAWFKKGYNSVIKAEPYDYDIEQKTNAVRYARGRAFAIYCKRMREPRAVWRKEVLAKTAQKRLISAVMYRYVI